jgi:hypothetical protein
MCPFELSATPASSPKLMSGGSFRKFGHRVERDFRDGLLGARDGHGAQGHQQRDGDTIHGSSSAFRAPLS